MMIGQGPKWVTAPVDRSYSGVRQIREIRFSPVERKWREKTVWHYHGKLWEGSILQRGLSVYRADNHE